MPRRKFIDKKTATTFQLVHRAQNDPRIHDDTAPSMVFKEVAPANIKNASEPAGSSASSSYSGYSEYTTGGSRKVKSRQDLEDEFGGKVRGNEGEAANYGVYYDDTEYDYMQHMRDLGTGGGESYFIEAPTKKTKGKNKMSLEDALRASSLHDDTASEGGVSLSSMASTSSAADLFGEDMAPSEFVRKTTYQDQQDIPDALAGFQPDMDPRLREVLEALEDEAYVDDDDDIFEHLARDGYEVDSQEWENSEFDADRSHEDGEGEGWETDDTIKPEKEYKAAAATNSENGPSMIPPADAPPTDSEGDADWMAEYRAFKKDAKAGKAKPVPSDALSFLTGASSLAGGRRKKRKGALTNTSSYSMTSSALFRTEGQTLLDERFDKIEEEYADDGGYDADDAASVISGVSAASGMSRMSSLSKMSESSQAPELVRADFDSIMDDFLGGYSMSGKRRVKKGAYQSGLEQLDEIRKGLGPARLKSSKA